MQVSRIYLHFNMKQHDCKNELKEANLRATPARVAILNLLEKTKQPIDANTIINFVNNEGIKTDPATVFRIMNMFMAKSIVLPIQLQEGKTRYELAGKTHHHHLVCEKCGIIEDVLSQAIPALEKEIRKKQKFLIKRHSLEFFGLCANCQK
jgi:Fur family transcriptional regulator, ferric uptake regulator